MLDMALTQIIDVDHPLYTEMIEVGVADISTKLANNECVVYRVQTFSALVAPVYKPHQVPFYTFFSAFRSALLHFCPQPVVAKEPADDLVEWAEDRGVRGLLGLQPVGNGGTRVYLSNPSALVLCKIAFS